MGGADLKTPSVKIGEFSRPLKERSILTSTLLPVLTQIRIRTRIQIQVQRQGATMAGATVQTLRTPAVSTARVLRGVALVPAKLKLLPKILTPINADSGIST
jgi:hypothetical protein